MARVADSQGNWISYLGGLTREAVVYHHTGGKNQVEFYAYQGITPSGWLGQGNTTWQQHNAYGSTEAVYHPAHSANSLSLVNNPELIGFNGNYQDPVSHNVFMGARVYNPSLQRFLQADSYDVANRYAYAQDNPIEKYDPSGHKAKWLKWLVAIGLAVAGGVDGVVSGGLGFAALAAEVTVSGVIGTASSLIGVLGSSLNLTGTVLQLAKHNLNLAQKLSLAGVALMSAALAGVATAGVVAESTAGGALESDDILTTGNQGNNEREFKLYNESDNESVKEIDLTGYVFDFNGSHDELPQNFSLSQSDGVTEEDFSDEALTEKSDGFNEENCLTEQDSDGVTEENSSDEELTEKSDDFNGENSLTKQDNDKLTKSEILQKVFKVWYDAWDERRVPDPEEYLV
jgi:RHS repeat-associated protein